jgi:FKBP-type peptidyl-prolyl cis-trans isomerase
VYYTITQFDGTLIDQNTSGAPTRLTYSQGRSYLPYMFYPALTALRTGEKYRFYTPFVYGYNDIQVEGLIPLRGIVVMEVELLNIIRNVPELLAAEKVDFENYLQENSLTVTDTLAGDTLRGDVLKILQTPGEGETPADGQKVTVEYAGSLLNGEEFDAGSIDVTLGSGGVIPGFEMAVRSMKKGEAATFLLPSRQAYADGVNNWFPLKELVGSPIAAHAPLVFEITVKEIQ